MDTVSRMKLPNTQSLNGIFDKALAYIKELHDIRVLGVHIFVIVALLVTWSGVGVIQANYQLQKRISELRQEAEFQKLENDTLRLRNQYFNTDQYLELTARRQFGLGAPGETLLLVPESVALANSIDMPDAKKTAENTKPQKPVYQQNFEAWMRFLFRRS